MSRVFDVLSGIIGILMGIGGVMWYVSPETAAERFGLETPTGLGLSSATGMIGGFCFAIMICIAMALYTKKASWYYPAFILMGLLAFGRAFSVVHGASFEVVNIIAEIAFTTILVFSSRREGLIR